MPERVLGPSLDGSLVVLEACGGVESTGPSAVPGEGGSWIVQADGIHQQVLHRVHDQWSPIEATSGLRQTRCEPFAPHGFQERPAVGTQVGMAGQIGGEALSQQRTGYHIESDTIRHSLAYGIRLPAPEGAVDPSTALHAEAHAHEVDRVIGNVDVELDRHARTYPVSLRGPTGTVNATR